MKETFSFLLRFLYIKSTGTKFSNQGKNNCVACNDNNGMQQLINVVFCCCFRAVNCIFLNMPVSFFLKFYDCILFVYYDLKQKLLLLTRYVGQKIYFLHNSHFTSGKESLLYCSGSYKLTRTTILSKFEFSFDSEPEKINCIILLFRNRNSLIHDINTLYVLKQY